MRQLTYDDTCHAVSPPCPPRQIRYRCVFVQLGIDPMFLFMAGLFRSGMASPPRRYLHGHEGPLCVYGLPGAPLQVGGAAGGGAPRTTAAAEGTRPLALEGGPFGMAGCEFFYGGDDDDDD